MNTCMCRVLHEEYPGGLRVLSEGVAILEYWQGGGTDFVACKPTAVKQLLAVTGCTASISSSSLSSKFIHWGVVIAKQVCCL